MVLMIFRVSRVMLLGSLITMVFCSKDYDPFADLTNAKAHVLSCSFAGSDTVGVYSTETIVIAVSGRDNVDSFSLHSAHNRFWQDTTVRRASPGEILPATTFSFDVSFFDTGVQTVSVTTWRRSTGESVTQDLSVRVTSPLRQADVTSFFGDSTLLCTPPVGDRDVLYEWDFEGSVTTSPRDTVKTVFPGAGSATGTLVVTDLAGNHATPRFFFSYSLFDTSRPIILCANTNVRNDTVVTRDSVLAFKAYIADYRGVSVDTCWINGAPFDIIYPRTNMYIKVLRNMPAHTTQTGAMRITVDAMDLTGRNKPSERIFWALFDPSGASSSGADISFLIPAKDSTTSGTRDFKIFGTADNFLSDSMTLRVTVNDSLYASPCVITGSNGIWTWQVHLGSYVNSITVSAYSPAAGGSRPLASAHIVIAYDPTAQDVIKPLIWDISSEGKQAGNMSTTHDSVALAVTAFDEWSGIQTLTINNQAMTLDSTGYIWRLTFGPIVHSAGGDTLLVRAVDRSQNARDTSIVIFKNSAPVLVSGPSFPASVCVDSSYTFRISTSDPDNDPVSIIPIGPPAGMVVSGDGTISWTPTAADVGTDTLAVRLSDGIQTSAPYVWTVTCVKSSSPTAAVRFTTRESAFPAFLQAQVDTLRIRLQVDTAGTGVDVAALRFSAKFVDNNAVVGFSTSAPVLVWPPSASDTGFRKLLVTVGNGTQVFDTISPSFLVVPRNQYPCSLSCTFTGDTTRRGELDLFTHPRPETLFFTIIDRDNPLTEKYTVTISQRAVNSIETLNKSDFFIVISPDSSKALDTIRVHIRDLTLTADSETFVVRYAVPNPYPLWQHSRSLVLNTSPSGADVAGNVTNFPVLVRLTNSNLSYNNFDFNQALPNGQDIRFAKFNGDTCSYQIERWLPAQGVAELWVKIDTVYGNNATQSIRMYWGNPAASAVSSGPATFDTGSGFQAVWHMGGAGTAQVTDATVNHFNGTPTALATGAATTGMIGQCQSFNGASSYVVMPGTANGKLNFPVQGTYSISAWVNTAVLDAQYHTIASKGDNQYSLQIMNIVNEWEFSECMVSGGWTTVASPASAGAWCFVTGVRKGTNEYLYVNGTCTDSAILIIANAVVQSTTDNFTIGRQPLNATYFFNGMIDEVRVSSTALSADWNKLCYMNQKAIDALVVFR